ncbi:MAG: sodium-dependent transporter [bacterium]
MTHRPRGQWSSQFGFVMAAAGSAVGLANIWAFPYRAGQNGGAAFVLVYLLCICMICLPFMFAEITLGRYGQKNVIGTIRSVTPQKGWLGLGVLSLAAGFFILSFYSVVAGWAVGFIFKTLLKNSATFPEFAAQPALVIPLFALFLAMTIFVVYGGVRNGIERWSKLLMPILVILMIALIIRGVTLDGANEGLSFYLNPDFSKINSKSIMSAMGQAFFSLSLGIGGILTYGSYLSKRENIIRSSVYIAMFDLLIAFLAGLMIFPALFAFNQMPNEGPALIFIVLPGIFEQLPFSFIVGPVFFMMITIAALTSSISMLEIPVAYFVDEKGWSRKKIVWLIGAFVFLLGLPSALSQGAVPALTKLSFFNDKSYLELMIFLWFDVFPPLGAILFCILIGWVWGLDKAVAELNMGAECLGKNFVGLPVSNAKVWGFAIRFMCPGAITLVWFNAIFN